MACFFQVFYFKCDQKGKLIPWAFWIIMLPRLEKRQDYHGHVAKIVFRVVKEGSNMPKLDPLFHKTTSILMHLKVCFFFHF